MKIYLHWLCNPDIVNHPTMVSDYQVDCIYHGLVDGGYDFSTNIYPWWMHKPNLEHPAEDYTKIWGKGFTMYGLLPDRVGNQDKPDLAIVGIHHTATNQDAFLCETLYALNKHGLKTYVVDGWDRSHICDGAITLSDKYFKRELDPNTRSIGKEVWPISFSIPAQHILPPSSPYNKSKAFAEIIPAMHSWGDHPHHKTYKYTTQQEYYQDYEDSYFAYTCCKAGWDCLRHYEIIANGCVPWFTDIEDCQETIMTNFPKDTCIEAKKIMGLCPGTNVPYDPNVETYLGDTRLINPGDKRGYLADNFDYEVYNSIRTYLLKYAKEHLTTKKTIEYILSK